MAGGLFDLALAWPNIRHHSESCSSSLRQFLANLPKAWTQLSYVGILHGIAWTWLAKEIERGNNLGVG